MRQPIDTSDQTRCPICGEANECAVAGGRPPESCWCMTATMDTAALQSIPAEAQGKVCICAGCASGTTSSD